MNAEKAKIIKAAADLHVHSVYSDGTMTPAELLAAAEERGISLFAIADHDVIDGSRELCRLAEKSSVKCIPAVELTACDRGRSVHVLAYGYSFKDKLFAAFVSENRRRLDNMSDRLIEIMERAGENVSVREYGLFRHDRRFGGWKALHYFVAKGITDSPHDGAELYPKFGIGYDKAGFFDVAKVCGVISRCGAVPVLAHPGVTFDAGDADLFAAKLRELAERGIAGIECFYPEHSRGTVVKCIEVCDELGLYVTGGTDCHGCFAGAEIGSLAVAEEEIRMPGRLTAN